MKPMECQSCGEVSLRYESTTPKRPFIETWVCECGHTECFHVSEQPARDAALKDELDTGWRSFKTHFPHADIMDIKLMKAAYFAGVKTGIQLQASTVTKIIKDTAIREQAE